MAFKGEVQDAHGLPLLWKFDEEEEVLLQLRQLPASPLYHAALFHHDGNKDDQFHTCQSLSPPGWHGESVKRCSHLIPIPVEWAYMFLDYPSLGAAFCRIVQLMLQAKAVERHLLWPFCEGVVLACGSPDPSAMDPISTINLTRKRIAYTKASLSSATAAWEGHCPASRKAPPPRQKSWAPSQLDLIFEESTREVEDNHSGGDSQYNSTPDTPPREANQRTSTSRGAQGSRVPVVLAPITAPAGLDLALLITTLLQAQLDTQLAETNTNHANLFAFFTATAQALAAKGGDKESKITVAKKRILQACVGVTHVDEFSVPLLYWDLDAKGGSSDAL
jgi:hypothetical protein